AIMGFFIAALFLPAGRLDWWAGWEFLGAFLSASIALTIWMRRRDSALMEERFRRAYYNLCKKGSARKNAARI
ncbi:hypothetical protein ACFLV7_16145, partial [Chloroflexota bacterium]